MIEKGWAKAHAEGRVEAAILKVVEFWWPLAKSKHHGHTWLVKTIPELQGKHEIDYSERALRGALQALREKGVLITEVRRNPFGRSGGNGLWIRPGCMVEPAQAAGQDMQGLQVGTCKICRLNIEQKNLQKTAGEQALVGQADGDKAMGARSQQFLAGKKAKVGIAGALQAFEGKGLEYYGHVSKPTDAHNCLRDAAVAAGYPAPGSFNPVRGGMLKTMLARFEQEGVGPMKVGETLYVVCSKWPEFVSWAETMFGLKIKAAVPNHDTVTKYAVEIAGFCKTASAPKAPAKTGGKKIGSFSGL